MELIDRQALIDSIEVIPWYHINEAGELASGANTELHTALYKEEDIFKALKNAPTVDAVPVVHGRWVAIDEDCEALDGETESKRWGCTNCHEIVEYDDYTHIQRLSPYCPNCGAKMDGGAEDG